MRARPPRAVRAPISLAAGALLAGALLVGGLATCRSATNPAARAAAPRDTGFDVEHYALELAIDPVRRAIDGSCRIRLWPTVERLERVELDLDGLEVRAVCDRDGRELAWAHAAGVLSIRLAEPLSAERCAELTIRYAGAPRRGLWFAAERDGLPTQIFTQGQPRDAHRWFPCVDDPRERATSELVVHVPAGWRVISSGERLERREQDGVAVERWRTVFPHPAYLATLVAGEFSLQEAEWDGIPLVYAAAPRLAGELAASFAETPAMLAFLSRATGVRYPFPRYAQTAVAGFPSGGMENLSATTLTELTVSDALARADQPQTTLLAHEVAHQWFGNLVTCRDWSELWLNEGFATYFAALYTAESRGADAFLIEMDDLRARWLARDQGPNQRPLVHGLCRDPLELFTSGHVYEGGAARLHHLRRLLGDEAFFRGVRLYLGLSRARSIGTEASQSAFEEASGRDLARHFERWFHGQGHPLVAARWTHDERRGELELSLSQAQPGETFPCLIEVEIADPRGVRVERLELEGRSARRVFAQPGAPRWVRLDPHAALPGLVDEERPISAWLELLADGPDAAARRTAARVLGQHLVQGVDSDVDTTLAAALARRAASEPNAAARAEVVRALGASALHLARTALLARAGEDLDASVRAAAFVALAARAPVDDAAEAARRELERGASRLAGAAALRVLAVQAGVGALALLERELTRGSPHGEWEALVLGEIGRLADPARARVLRAWAADPSVHTLARRAAVQGLAPLALESAGVRADLALLLDTADAPLAGDVIAALAQALTPEVRRRLSAHARATPHASERLAIADALAAGE